MKWAKSYRSPDRVPKAHVQVPTAAIIGLRIALEFGKRQPTLKQLMERYGMSRATAYRWRSAWTYVAGIEITPSKPEP